MIDLTALYIAMLIMSALSILAMLCAFILLARRLRRLEDVAHYHAPGFGQLPIDVEYVPRHEAHTDPASAAPVATLHAQRPLTDRENIVPGFGIDPTPKSARAHVNAADAS